MNHHRHFCQQFLLIFVGFMLAVGLFNLMVDPYGIWGNSGLHRVNRVKHKQADRERLFKAVAVMTLKPKIILMGSSRTLLGLDPDSLAERQENPVYNLSLSATGMREIRRYFEHTLANQPQLKEVILGLDFFMFDQHRKLHADYDEDLMGRSSLPLDKGLKTLFSLGVLKDSVATVLFNFRAPAGDSDYKPNGLMDINVIDARAIKKFGSRWKAFENSLISDFSGGAYYSKYQASLTAYEDLIAIVKTCEKNGVRLSLFISPLHVSQWESLRLGGLWPEYDHWRGQLESVFPVWDFSGYNSVTTEPISDTMQNYIDSSHYTQRVGHWMLNKILGLEDPTIPSDFGVLLTAQNIKAELANREKAFNDWAEGKADLMAWLKKLQNTHD